MGRLDEFVAPRTKLTLIGAMTTVNRIVMLKGVAGLRDLPPLNRIAGLRGIANIRTIDFPEADQGREAGGRFAGRGKTTFLTPNHPEFFTDWMIDKEISSRVCPEGGVLGDQRRRQRSGPTGAEILAGEQSDRPDPRQQRAGAGPLGRMGDEG